MTLGCECSASRAQQAAVLSKQQCSASSEGGLSDWAGQSCTGQQPSSLMLVVSLQP